MPSASKATRKQKHWPACPKASLICIKNKQGQKDAWKCSHPDLARLRFPRLAGTHPAWLQSKCPPTCSPVRRAYSLPRAGGLWGASPG